MQQTTMNDDRKTWKHKGSDGRFHVWHAGKNAVHNLELRFQWLPVMHALP
jgi:hypothetical protein